MNVEQLTRDDRDEVVSILISSFSDYPVFEYILQDASEADYPVVLEALVSFYTDLRFARGDLVLGTRENGSLACAALVNRPDSRGWPREVIARARQAIGEAAWNRMSEYERRAAGPKPEARHYYIGMIGTVPEHQGVGHGSAILDAVAQMSLEHPDSRGVYLTTETEGNVFLYRRNGYAVLGETDVDDVHSWCMFRQNDVADSEY